MITDAVVGVILFPITWLVSLLPEVTLPGWATTVPGWATDVGEQMGALNKWLPIHELLEVVPMILLLASGVLLFKVTQFVVSLFTGGGGAT